MADETDFLIAFDLVVGVEGGYSTDPNDSGNWTGGAVGSGTCNGTKYGISAASYPSLDIKNLSLTEACAIYRRDYWVPAQCAQLPARLAYVVFDGAVNNGVSRAIRFLQTAIGTSADGAWGPNSQAALTAALVRDPSDTTLAAEVHARRIYFMAGLTTWATYGLGWSRRLSTVALQAGLYWPDPPVVIPDRPPVDPAPADPAPPAGGGQAPGAHYLLQFFRYSHLPERLQGTSRPFAELAAAIDRDSPHNPESTTALRKLLEAKDCAVRSVLFEG